MMLKKFLFTLFAVTILLLVAEYFFAQSSDLLTGNIVMIGTVVLAIITLSTFLMGYRASLKAKPYQFVNGVMGSTFLKFTLCILAAAVYIYLERKNINKPDLFFMMLLYVIYTSIETLFLFSASKSNQKQ